MDQQCHIMYLLYLCFRKGINVFSHNVSTTFAGFLIYFGYGIRNSAEAVNRSKTYTPACTIKGEAMATEKEAFLHNRQKATGDDEEDS